MAKNPFKSSTLCKPLAAMAVLSERLPYGAKWDLLSKAVDEQWHAQLAAVERTEVTAEAKKLARDRLIRSYFESRSMFERATFGFSKFDSEEIRGWLLGMPAARSLANRGASATDGFKLAGIRHSSFMNTMTTLGRRLMQSGMRSGGWSDHAAYLAFATGNAEKIIEATRIGSRKERIAALKLALKDTSKANNFTDFSWDGKPLDKTRIERLVSQLLDHDLTPQMIDDMGHLYAEAGRLRSEYTAWWRADFQKMQGRAPTDEEQFKAVGGTFGAFMPRIWRNEYKSGFQDELIAATARDGGYDHNTGGLRTDSEFIPFPQLLRRISQTTEKSPLTIGQKTLRSPEEAVEFLFPGLTAAQKREAPNQIRHMVNAANDAVVNRAVPAELEMPFLQHRAGMLGFNQSFLDSILAYLNYSSRTKEFNPLMAPGGEMHDFLVDFTRANAPAAKAYANHIDALMGRNGLVDKELMGLMHPVTRAVANAIFLYNPAPVLLNLTSVVLQAIPYAMSDGFIAGGKDLIAAASMWRHPAFRSLFDEGKLGGSFAYGFSTNAEKFGQLAIRLQNAQKDGDMLAAAVAFKELGITSGEWLAWSETALIRPAAAALGLARFYRRNNLHLASELSLAQKEEAWRAMMAHIDQTTTIQGGLNSAPYLNLIRQNIPVVGSMAGMLTVTPANLFLQFVRDARRVVSPMTEAEMRKPAARRLATQAVFGTLVAGPFWFYPMWKEAEDDGDKSAIFEYAQAFERNFSLAGLLNTELADRLNPITGVVERFAPSENTLTSLALGPAGRPASDLYNAILGEPRAQAKALGALAGMAEVPPDTILPSSLQYLAPGGIAAEKLLKLLAPFIFGTDASGKVDAGLLSIPVPTLDGNRVDANGRPFLAGGDRSGGIGISRIRNYTFGGRALDEANAAAEGISHEKRTEHRQRVEQQVRRLILDGDMDAATKVIIQNDGLDIQITQSELEKESIMRTLLPQARAVYSGPINDSLRRFLESAQKLESGKLTRTEAKNERHIFIAGLLRFGGQ